MFQWPLGNSFPSGPPLEPNTAPENPSEQAIGAPTSSSLERGPGAIRDNLFTQEVPTTRAGHICCAHDFTMLSECTCGAIVTQDEISAEHDVIRCRRPGCETIWVSLTPPKEMNIDSHMTSVLSSVHRAQVCNWYWTCGSDH